MKRSGKILLEGTIEEFKKHCKGADNREYLLINTKEIRKDGTYAVYKQGNESDRVISVSIKGKYRDTSRLSLQQLYLTFKILEAGTVAYNYPSWISNLPLNYVEYSTNKGSSWHPMSEVVKSLWGGTGTQDVTLLVVPGDIIMFRGNWDTLFKSPSGYYTNLTSGRFTGTAEFEVYGNILSLLYGDNFTEHATIENTNNGYFYNLFNLAKCISAKHLILPKNVSNLCYFAMFTNSSIVEPPELPVLTLALGCYSYMFLNCKFLELAPKLPAELLADSCYYRMFYNCDKLIEVPELPATVLYSLCYKCMFSGCESLLHIPALPATLTASECYYEMFKDCISIEGTPILRGSSNSSLCYTSMFYNCPNIRVIRVLNKNINLSGVSNIGYITSLSDIPRYIVVDKDNKLIDGSLTLPFIRVNDGYECNYLTFIILEKGNIKFNSSSLTNTISYSINDALWSLEASNINIPVKQGDKITFKGNMVPTIEGIGTFKNSTALFNVLGNVMSLLYGDLFIWETDLTDKLSSFKYLFKDTNIIDASSLVLPSSILSDSCYYGMFLGCTLLVEAPLLIAERLAPSCYSLMFKGCISLLSAPELNAEILTENCYNSMFKDCSSLNYIRLLALDITATNCLTDWVTNVSNAGVFEKNTLEIPTGVSGIPESWTTEVVDFSLRYLTLCAKSSGTLNFKGATSTSLISYSVNNGDTWSEPAQNVEILVHNNDKVLWKSTNPETNSTLGMGSFRDSTAYYNIEGNIMSLSYGDDFIGQTSLSKTNAFKMLFSYSTVTSAHNLILPATTLSSDCYRSMFFASSSLKQAPKLVATTLSANCYYSMFYGTGIEITPVLAASTLYSKSYYNMFRYSAVNTVSLIDATVLNTDCCSYMFAGCRKLREAVVPPATTLSQLCYVSMFSLSGIITPPLLPATTLAKSCYNGMFIECLSLVSAPELPAVSLIESCYNSMFKKCIGLLLAPALPATTLAKNCYYLMFGDCTSLATAPELPATTLALSCYESMFKGCTALTIAPELQATTLADNCYSSMFYGCTSLTTPPELPATILTNKCYYEMFRGCTSLTTASAILATTMANSACGKMFCDCTSLTQAPVLLATTMTDYCYDSMFDGCTSLIHVPELSATTLAPSCYTSMFANCTSLIQAPALPAITLANYCYNGMFRNCSELITAPELLAPILATGCYQGMFYGCTGLNNITMLATNISASSCLMNWVYGVAASGTFTKSADMTSLPRNQNGIPSRWTVVDYVEE